MREGLECFLLTRLKYFNVFCLHILSRLLQLTQAIAAHVLTAEGGNSIGIAAENADFGYLTCVGGVIHGDSEKIVQSYNIRHLPENTGKEVATVIENSVKAFGGKVKVTSESVGYFVSADDNKIKALTKACESVLGYECKPYTMGGGTSARWLPNTVAFGSGILEERNFLGDERGNAHQRDEYISKRELFAGMEIYSRALGNLSEIL